VATNPLPKRFQLHGHRGLVLADKEHEKQLAAKLQDCKNIFIDAGANIGMHARFLFEPEQYPESTFVRVFDEQFGPVEQRGSSVCAIEFEPNPEHATRQTKLSAAYEKVGWRVVFAPYAVGDATSVLTFYDNDGGSNEGVGFGVQDRSGQAGKVPDAMPINVTSIDFPYFVQLLSERKDASSGKVVIKMDIEGAEFYVLPAMITRGALCCCVDYIAGEFHARLAPFSFEGHHASEYADEAAALRGQQMLMDMVADQAYACRTKKLGDEDDEAYLSDRNTDQLADPQPANPNATTAAPADGPEQRCLSLKETYGVQPGVSWGSLPRENWAEWRELGCDAIDSVNPKLEGGAGL